jgi:glycerophosphoryl diester phosphodiesterase
MIKRIALALLAIVGCLSLTLFGLTHLTPEPAKPAGFEIVAHRGVHQDYEGSSKGIRVGKAYLSECTATRIYKPTHHYLENTVESIKVAFEYGATMVEIDIRPTRDNQLVVFHDWMLECRTNGRGNVSDHTLEQLKTLDIGHGYTHDGQTYPFRGKGVGGIKTLSEVLKRFPDKKFLIDNKNGNHIQTAQLIVEALSQLPANQQKLIYLWCADKAFAYIKAKLPSAKRLLLTRKQAKEILVPYMYKFGFGELPKQYKNGGLGLPANYLWFAWGWPNRLLGKVYEADMRFYVYINDIEKADEIAGVPINGIISDRIERLGPYFRKVHAARD